jgi:hypothetical protein
VDEQRKDELRRQIETVWRMASSSLGTLREVVVRSSQSGRLRVDLALAAKERQQLLAQLGEEVLHLVAEGRLNVPKSAERLYERICELDQRIATDSSKVHDNAFGASRGYEPEAGNYDEVEIDEHAELAETKSKSAPKRKRKGGSR